MQPINRLFVMVRITNESFIFERLGHRGAFGIMKLKVKPQIKKIALLKKVVDRSVDYPLIDK